MGKCCFIGHRNIQNESELKNKLIKLIENLINEENVDTFLFGSRSAFNNLSYDIVEKLKSKYSFIKKIGYQSKNEKFFLYEEKIYFDKTYFNVRNIKSNFPYFDQIIYNKTIIDAGKYSYIERNKTMIDDSNICIFYYDKNCNYKSGTKIAFEYAKTKHKKIINLYS